MTNYQLRALAEAATPGPWWRTIDCDVYSGTGLGTDVLVAEIGFSVKDAEFIAAANPATVLALLDERDELQGRIDAAVALWQTYDKRVENPVPMANGMDRDHLMIRAADRMYAALTARTEIGEKN